MLDLPRFDRLVLASLVLSLSLGLVACSEETTPPAEEKPEAEPPPEEAVPEDPEVGWSAHRELPERVVFLGEGPDDGVWLLSAVEDPSYVGPTVYRISLLDAELEERCASTFEKFESGVALVRGAVDPDLGLVLAVQEAASVDILRVDGACQRSPWLSLASASSAPEPQLPQTTLLCITGTPYLPRTGFVATREAVFLECEPNGSYFSVFANASLPAGTFAYVDPYLRSARMERSPLGDRVALVDDISGDAWILDGATAQIVSQHPGAVDVLIENVNDTDDVESLQLVMEEEGFGVVAARRIAPLNLQGDDRHVEEVTSLFPEATPEAIAPFAGLRVDLPVVGHDAPLGFLPTPGLSVFTGGAWIALGVRQTEGIGPGGDATGMLAEHAASLRLVLPDREPRRFTFGGGWSSPRAITATTSGAFVVAVEAGARLEVDGRVFEAGGTILSRAESAAVVYEAGEDELDVCPLFSLGCAECVEALQVNCLSYVSPCAVALLDAQDCACSAQLAGAGEEAVRACLVPLAEASPEPDSVVDSILEACSAECSP